MDKFKFYFKVTVSSLSREHSSGKKTFWKTSNKLWLYWGWHSMKWHVCYNSNWKKLYLPPPSRIISEYSVKLIWPLQREDALFQKKSFVILSSPKRIIMFENILLCLIYLLNIPSPVCSNSISLKLWKPSFLTGTLRIPCYIHNCIQVSLELYD